MRRFVLAAHAVPAHGRWHLDDLPGAGGRVDVLCRAVAAALFLSHGIRRDTEVVLALAGPPPRAVRLRGDAVRHLNPDERSTAARIRQALQAAQPDPWWQPVQDGLEVAELDLAGVLADRGAPGPVVLLHRDGEDARDGATPPLPADATYVLSDHLPFAPQEETLLGQRAARRLGLGPTWYHADHAVHVVQWLLDRQAAGLP